MSSAATTAMEAPATTHAGISVGRIAPCLATMVITTEGAGADTALTMWLRISPGSLRVSIERPGRCAGTIVDGTAVADAPLHVRGYASLPSRPVVAAAVVKCVASRVVPVVVINCVSSSPIKSPAVPAPSETAEKTDSEAGTE